MATFVPLKKESQRSATLRDIAKQVGVRGAEPTDAFEFISKATTGERAAALQGLEGFDINSAKVRLSEQELAKQLGERLRTSGPATFRNLRDVIGAEALSGLQQTYGLQNIPESVFPAESKVKPERAITTTGNVGGDTGFTGFRKTLKESLIPETPEASARRKIVGERKQDELATAIETQLNEEIATSQKPEGNLLERITGVGQSFLDRLFGEKPETKQPPQTTVAIPETGEVLDFEQDNFIGNVSPQIRQLEDDALIAISEGANPIQVRERLAQMVQQIQAQRGNK